MKDNHNNDATDSLKAIVDGIADPAVLVDENLTPILNNSQWTRFEIDQKIDLTDIVGTQYATLKRINFGGKTCFFRFSISGVFSFEQKPARLIQAILVDDIISENDDIVIQNDLMSKMLNSSSDCIKILSPDGKIRRINNAGCTALGVDSVSGIGRDWLDLLPSSVKKDGNKALSDARLGKIGRFPGISQLHEKEPQYWDNMLTPILDSVGKVSDIICISRDVTTEFIKSEELKETQKELKKAHRSVEASLQAKTLMAKQMHYRIVNIFSVISGLISISKRDYVSDVGAQSALDTLRKRISAMARASDYLSDDNLIGDFFDPIKITKSVLDPYGAQVNFTGSAHKMPKNLLMPLSILLHELSIYSLSSGALGCPDGEVIINWETLGEDIILTWKDYNPTQEDVLVNIENNMIKTALKMLEAKINHSTNNAEATFKIKIAAKF